MSQKSIDSKIQGLEERLRTEHGHPRRPRPGVTIGGHPRPRRQLELSIPAVTVSQASQETEAKLLEIHQMSGALQINGVSYRSDISDLQHLGELGNGTCGHVVKMLHRPSNVVIAVKQMRRSGNSEENKRILMDLEVVLRSHDCPYIVRCLGYFITDTDVWICMELMSSCFEKILKRLGGPIPEEILGKVTVATVKALSYLKEDHGVIHRDVKPSNILVDERGVVKLCDFGISGRLVDSKAKTRSAGCAAYMAPERIDPPDPQRPDYDIRADVWSLGITLVELATGNFPYCDCQNDFEVLSKVIEEEPPALPDSQTFSEEFKSFVRQCLTKDYRNRPKYAALLGHPFVERAAKSDASVATWFATTLPPGSPRALVMPPVFCHNLINGEKINSDHQISSTTQINGFIDMQTGNDNKDTFKVASNSSKISSPTSPKSDTSDKIIKSKEEKVSLVIRSPTENKTTNNSTSSRITNLENYESAFMKKLRLEPNLDDELAKSISQDNNVSIFEPTENDYSTNGKRVSENNIISPERLVLNSNNDILNRSNSQNHPSNLNSKEFHINSPQNYRTRSLSNTSPQGVNTVSERWPPPKFITGSPTTKNYFSNLEAKNQPFSGGGGPSSFDNYVNYGPCQDVQSGFRSYGSPEVKRRQYYSPSRNRLVYNYEYGNPRMESQNSGITAPHVNQRKDDGYKNMPDNGRPCFRPNGPTNYFVSTSVCTMSKYPSTSIRYRNEVPNVGNFHQNIGGSCSQPASLEAYGDMRHNPSGQPRLNEKNFSPPLWSPQLGCRWSGRSERDRDRDREDKEREVRRMSDTNHHQQGNTSPIVLQRFYHQQGQRRSRRDWDASPRQLSSSSLSRDTSVGRSPEPPRRAHRDPSVPRDHHPLHMLEHNMLREWRERELTPSRQNLVDKNETMLASLENDKPELLNRSPICEKNQVDCKFLPIAHKNNEHVCNDSSFQFDMKLHKPSCHYHKREKDTRTETNGDCHNVDRDDKTNNESGSFSNIRDRLLLERKNSKERTSVLRDRDKKESVNDGEHKEEINHQLSPLMLRRLGKANGKDKDEQGGSRSSSPNRTLLTGGSAKVSRFTSHPQRITASDYDDVSKCSQDISRNLISDTRNGGRVPQVPPRKASASWSLPASPLPTRP